MTEHFREFDYTPSDYIIDLPVTIRKEGLAEYPRFAVEDFDSAFTRFMILIGADKPFGDHQEHQFMLDAEAFPELALYGERGTHFIMPEEQALDFVAAVTGHPRTWVASWNYRVTISDLVTEHGQDWATLTNAFDKAYRDALRFGSNSTAVVKT